MIYILTSVAITQAVLLGGTFFFVIPAKRTRPLLWTKIFLKRYPKLVEIYRNQVLQHSWTMKAEGDVHANKCCYKFRMSRWTILFSSVIPVSGTRQINQTFIQRLLTILDQEFFKGLHKRKLRKQYRKITLAFWLPIKRRFFLTFFSPLNFFPHFFPDFFPDFFLDFFPDFFLDSFSDFFPDVCLDFFHRSSYTSKAHSWVESLRDVARLDSWLCNRFIYRWKCNTMQFDLRSFLSYNKAMAMLG